MVQFLSTVCVIVNFFLSFWRTMPVGPLLTVTVGAPEKAGCDWVCTIDDENMLKLRGSSATSGEAGEETRSFTLQAPINAMGCACVTFCYTDGDESAGSDLRRVYTYSVNGMNLIGGIAETAVVEYPAGVKVSASKGDILAQYTAVMNNAKIKGKGYAGAVYTDVDWRIDVPGTSIDFKPGTNTFVPGTQSTMVNFPIMLSAGCMLTDASRIKYALKETLPGGLTRLTIELYDEPEGEKYIHEMFNVPNGGVFELPVAEQFDIENFACKYFGCKAVLVCDAQGNAVTLEHNIGYGITGTVKIAGVSCNITGNPVDNERYFDFAW